MVGVKRSDELFTTSKTNYHARASFFSDSQLVYISKMLARSAIFFLHHLPLPADHLGITLVLLTGHVWPIQVYLDNSSENFLKRPNVLNKREKWFIIINICLFITLLNFRLHRRNLKTMRNSQENFRLSPWLCWAANILEISHKISQAWIRQRVNCFRSRINSPWLKTWRETVEAIDCLVSVFLSKAELKIYLLFCLFIVWLVYFYFKVAKMTSFTLNHLKKS